MLPLDDVSAFIEEMLRDGENHTDVIVEAVYDRFGSDIDMETAVRSLIKRRVSLAISQMRGDDGERVAFSSRDEFGKPVVIHLDYTNDHTALVEVAHRYIKIAKAATKIADRLMERAGQLSLDLAGIA